MANVSINPVQPSFSRHQYSSFSALTLDLGDLQPGRVIEVNPDDNWRTVVGKGVARLAPQVFPAYGRCNLKTAAFFVSQSQLMECSKAFHNKQATYKGKSVSTVWFKADSLNRYFYNYNAVASVPRLCFEVHTTSDPITTPPTGSFDFCYAYNSAGTVVYKFMKLTPIGRSYFKIAKSLGYDFVSYPCVSGSTLLTWSELSPYVQFHVNALPLLAYLKVYADYFMNPHFYNDSPLVSFLHYVYNDDNFSDSLLNTVYNNYSGELTDYFWSYINPLGLCVPYEHNMYLDAFNSPNSPTGISPATSMSSMSPDGLLSPYLPNLTSGSSQGTSDASASDSLASFLKSSQSSTGVPLSSPNLGALTQLGLFNLKSVFDYVNRNNISGSKSVEQFFARFGIKTKDYNHYFASKLFESSSNVDFSAVLSNTDNFDSSSGDGKTLGAYAGFGAAGLDFKFDYKSDDYGFVIVLHWVQIVPIKVRGMSPSVLRIHPEDWWKPEFDGKALRAIPQCELGVNKYSDSDVAASNADIQIYGFTDIYDDYREQPDCVCGDFCFDEVASRFLFSRDFSYYRRIASNVHVQPQTTMIQYMNRVYNPDVPNVFQLGQQNGDRFYVFVSYSMDAQRQLLSKSDSLMLNGEGDQSIELGGTQIR